MKRIKRGLMQRLVLVVAIVVLIAAPALADFDAGVAAYQRGDYAAALKELQPLANQGIAKAQHNLGLMYLKGQGVPQDYATARSWFEKAAKQRHEPAFLNLALMYREGLGAAPDYVAAAELYRIAAHYGNVEGQYNLGVFYLTGTGVPVDTVQAWVWSDLASKFYPAGRYRDDALRNRNAAAAKMTKEQKREAEGQTAFRQGVMYNTGKGIKQDKVKAYKFYCTAVSAGINPAKMMIYYLSENKSKDLVIGVVQTGIDPLPWAAKTLTTTDAILQAMGLPKISDLPVSELCP